MPSAADSGAQRAQPRMLAPGYYSQECNAHKRCDPGNPIIICARFTELYLTLRVTWWREIRKREITYWEPGTV